MSLSPTRFLYAFVFMTSISFSNIECLSLVTYNIKLIDMGISFEPVLGYQLFAIVLSPLHQGSTSLLFILLCM